MSDIEIRTAYERQRLAITFTAPSMAQQHFREECDINNIMARYEKTGLIEHAARFGGRYEDVTAGLDYHEACNMIIRAQEAFATLPARVRAHFDNDPAAFLAAVEDPDRKDELRELGLLRMPSNGAAEGGAEPAPAGPADPSGSALAPTDDA